MVMEDVEKSISVNEDRIKEVKVISDTFEDSKKTIKNEEDIIFFLKDRSLLIGLNLYQV